MKSAVFALLAAFLAASTVSAGSILSEDQYQFLFTKWVQQQNKNYATSEMFSKYATFKNNIDLIVAHNAKPDETYKMAVNQFADLTNEEFQQKMGLKTNANKMQSKPALPEQTPCERNSTRSSNDKNVDWTSKMPAVRDQQQCGSCWAFSAVGAIAGGYAAAGKGSLANLSEQQLVDCCTSSFDRSFISEGCDGGLMSEAIQYASKAGLCADSDYPYTGRDGACKSSTCKSQVNVAGYAEVHGDAEFKKNIAAAPFSIGIAASSSAFQFYNSGVVTKCTDRSLNHGVVLVGYYPEETQPFYLVRNSWGAGWGDKGHIRLSTEGNQCGVATSPWDVIAKF